MVLRRVQHLLCGDESDKLRLAGVCGCNHYVMQWLHNWAKHIQHGTVETASHTSQVNGLISFLNSPFQSPPPVGSRVSGDKAYKGFSAFIRVQCRAWGKYGEVKFVWVQADTCVVRFTPLKCSLMTGATRLRFFESCDTTYCAVPDPVWEKLLSHQIRHSTGGSITVLLHIVPDLYHIVLWYFVWYRIVSFALRAVLCQH